MLWIAAGCLAIFGLIAPRLGTEFLPALEEGNLWIRATMPPTISLEAGEPIVNRIREILLRYPEVVTVVSQHGRPDNGSDAAGFNNAEFFRAAAAVRSVAGRRHQGKADRQLQGIFAKEFVGIGFNFSQYIQDNIEEGLSGVKGENSVKIVGHDLAKLEQLAALVMKEMATTGGVTRSWCVPGAWTTEPQHSGQSGKGGAVRPQRRRCQFSGSGCTGRNGGDDAFGIGAAVFRHGPAWTGIS